MNLETSISLISAVSLLYFAYGTWRIDRTLSRVDKNIAKIASTVTAWSENPDHDDQKH